MLNEYENLSEGIKNGFLVLFCKDAKIRPILLSKDQANLLNISLSIPFQNKEIVLGKGNVNIENGILKGPTINEKTAANQELETFKSLCEAQTELREPYVYFSFNGVKITNPFIDENGIWPVDPIEYYKENFTNSEFYKLYLKLLK